jgi:hypothetical protein
MGVIALVYSLGRLVMFEPDRRQQVEPGRISFIDTLPYLTNARHGESLHKQKVRRVGH